VAILLPNRPEFVASFFGAIKIGAVPAAMSFAITPKEPEPGQAACTGPRPSHTASFM
jgi:acyl-CoA synthetase (AMP-forming)/AMP-acid ligase II